MSSFRILLALSKKEVRERVSFTLESYFGAKIIEVSSAKEGVDIVQNDRKISLVICEFPGIGDVLLRNLGSMSKRSSGTAQAKVPVIVCFFSEKQDKALEIMKHLNVVGVAPWTSLIDSIVQAIESQIGLKKIRVTGETAENLTKSSAPEAPKEAKESEKKRPTEEDMVRIKTALLVRVGKLKGDIYIKLSTTHFVKLFQEGDEFEEADYKRMISEKKQEYLFLRTNQIDEFVSKFKLDLLNLLKSEAFSDDSSQEMLETVHETAQELLNKIGATEEVQEVIKSSVQATVKTMLRSPTLASILKRIKADPDKYISSHSILLPQFASAIALGMEWKSDLTLQKLSLAAFLHDVPLANHQLAQITSLTELKRRKDQYTPKEVKDYELHPIRASELAKQFNEVPADVDTILVQHHEQPDGTGFPRGMGAMYISPLAAVFIVAHDICSNIFDSQKPFLMSEFVDRNKERYESSNFKKILKILESMR